MKKSKKLLAFLLSVLTVVLIVCPAIVVNAATVKSISAGSYVRVTSTKYYYKVTVEKEGYITLYGKGEKDSTGYSGYAYFRLLNSKKKEFLYNSYPDYVRVDNYNKKTASVKYPVSKGTYYIHAEDLSSYGKYSVKYTFKAVTQPTNYCIAKAKTLASGTVDTIYQTPGYDFDRWYKITLKSNKKITVISDAECKIFDVEGNEIDRDYSSTASGQRKYVTKSKMAAGTYYLCSPSCYYVKRAELVTLKWS